MGNLDLRAKEVKGLGMFMQSGVCVVFGVLGALWGGLARGSWLFGVWFSGLGKTYRVTMSVVCLCLWKRVWGLELLVGCVGGGCVTVRWLAGLGSIPVMLHQSVVSTSASDCMLLYLPVPVILVAVEASPTFCASIFEHCLGKVVFSPRFLNPTTRPRFPCTTLFHR